ncbi:MAG TPA: TIGR03619 family F420-dependent LLM class oxidoreductase, partial [Acidimicrobiales bacterium]|nr:TIGR03619 family F420-dependent LLM class oxidoreductase [Acidimicrobiales bacterium]
KDLESKYTYSVRTDGAPGWEKDTSWPDPMCLCAGLATVTSTMIFTTGVYVAPARDLITVAKSVGTTAVLSDNRIRLGVGVGWCREEFEQTGQEFSTRGKRLDDMIPALRALWNDGWVEYHGPHYDVPACQMLPAPTEPVPILGGGHSGPALRRAATLCDGWIAAGAYTEAEAWEHLAALRIELDKAGRQDEPFTTYLSVAERPDVDLYRRFEDAGVTDMVCAPWMFAPIKDGATTEQVLATRIGACEWFAEHILAKMA